MAEREIDFLQTLCKPEMDSVDAGAYEGVYTKEAARLSNMVFAFEPVPQRYQQLTTRRFVKNKNVVVYPYALSDSNGQKMLYVPRLLNRFHKEYPLHAMASTSGSYDSYYKQSRGYLREEKITVESRTLDSFQQENVEFIKIDVEGHEEAVLQGAAITIAASHPHILVEIAERHNPGGFQRINERLGKQGYFGFFVYEDNLFPNEKFDMDKMQNKPLEFIKHRLTPIIPGYVNNFIFIHKNQIGVVDLLQQQLRKG